MNHKWIIAIVVLLLIPTVLLEEVFLLEEQATALYAGQC